MESLRTITKIEEQVKRKNRRSIHLDGEFAFGLDAEVVAQFDLKEGSTLRPEDIQRLILEEEKKKAKEKALRLLALRARSEQEMVSKLRDAGYDESLIGSVVGDLRRVNLLNDEEFARSYAKSRLTNRPVGERALQVELRRKGIAEATIEKVLGEAYGEKSPRQLVQELIEKRKPRYRNLDEKAAKKKLADFLLRRGFDWEIVSDVLGETT